METPREADFGAPAEPARAPPVTIPERCAGECGGTVTIADRPSNPADPWFCRSCSRGARAVRPQFGAGVRRSIEKWATKTALAWGEQDAVPWPEFLGARLIEAAALQGIEEQQPPTDRVQSR